MKEGIIMNDKIKVSVTTGICEQVNELTPEALAILLQCDSITLDGDKVSKIKSKTFNMIDYGNDYTVSIEAE